MKTSSKVPTPRELALIEQQSRLRGQILGAYAQSEFLLLDVAMQTRILQEYWSLGLKYHRKLDNRVSQVRALFGAPGPLHKYELRVSSLVDRLEPLKNHRDLFAHAFCRIHYRGQDAAFIYKMWRMDDGDVAQIERVFSEKELVALERQITAIAQDFILLFSEIYLQEELEKFSMQPKTMP